MIIEALLTFLIVFFGGITVTLSVLVAKVFRDFSKRVNSIDSKRGKFKLANAVKWQLAGEAVIGLGTILFAVLTHFNLVASISTIDQSLIRLIMVLATSITTIHLWLIVYSLKRK